MCGLWFRYKTNTKTWHLTSSSIPCSDAVVLNFEIYKKRLFVTNLSTWNASSNAIDVDNFDRLLKMITRRFTCEYTLYSCERFIIYVVTFKVAMYCMWVVCLCAKRMNVLPLNYQETCKWAQVNGSWRLQSVVAKCLKQCQA